MTFLPYIVPFIFLCFSGFALSEDGKGFRISRGKRERHKRMDPVEKRTRGTTPVSCRDESGDPVDWFIVLKYPNSPEYAYTDSRNTYHGLYKSPFTLDSVDEGAVAATLRSIYYYNLDGNTSATAERNMIGYVQYNDEWPDNRKHGTGAHSKGVFGFDFNGGFWFIHSIPRFPDFARKKVYPGLPEDEYKYGQSMMCISMGLSDLDIAAAQLLIAYPWTYDAEIPFGMDLPNMSLLAKEANHHRDHHYYYASNETTSSVKRLKSNEGTLFTSFYKSPKWGKYLYEDMVEPYFDVGMMWETWMNGINPDPTFCSPDHPYNSINIRYVRVDGEIWKETQDHSKWGLSIYNGVVGSNERIVCIGDMNRQKSQNNRGGGTVCVKDKDLWLAFSQVVLSYDECDFVFENLSSRYALH